MHPSVQAAFLGFTRPLEGVVSYMYCDVLGLVTTGVGNLIDSVPAAMALPWRHLSDGAPATPAEVATEWHAVKDSRIPAWKGMRPLVLQDLDVEALVEQRLQHNESYLSRRWQNWNDWPADAQLGAHSCAWAAGAGWLAPHFDVAVNALDFDTAAIECQLNATGNPGLVPRNAANKLLFTNAAKTVAAGMDRSHLWYPLVLQ